MEIPDSYFEDEVREGFFVPSLMKRAWAARLEILEAVQSICEKHNICYFAEWGTLLGAVRHGGFIPWDDDLDICMLREDYDQFRAVADEELPDGCWFMDYRWNDDFDHLIGRIINSHVLILEGEQLEKYHGFPYVAGIDIFWMDDLPADKEEEDAYHEQIDFLIRFIYAMRLHKSGEIKLDAKGLEQYVSQTEEMFGVLIDRKKPVKQQLYAILEKVAAPRYKNDIIDEENEITNLPVWRENQNYRLPKRCYSEFVTIPFEMIQVPVPAGYGELLGKKYGASWMKPVRSGGSHDYPSYKEQERNLKKEGAGILFEYAYSEQERQEAEEERKQREAERERLRKQIEDFFQLFLEAHEAIGRCLEAEDATDALGILEECQNAAMQLGTLIEEEWGEGHPTVHVLEQYCEDVYRLHQQICGKENPAAECSTENTDFDSVRDITYVEISKDLKQLKDYEVQLQESVRTQMKEKKEVVFIPYKDAFWETMEPLWKIATDDKGTEVFVVPAPYYYKDALGRVKKDHPNLEADYPDEVELTYYGAYPFEKRHPDMIVIQCPYDEYNYTLTIHPFFYAKNLKKYTKQLVYIVPFMMDEIGPGDGRARETLKYLCNMPGVVHADTIVVQSEQMKDVYVELLTEFAGKDTETMWREKIIAWQSE